MEATAHHIFKKCKTCNNEFDYGVKGYHGNQLYFCGVICQTLHLEWGRMPEERRPSLISLYRNFIGIDDVDEEC